MVLATQNPIEQDGTDELPEGQLDRFLLKEILTYPNLGEEVAILDRIERGVFASPLQTSAVVRIEDVLFLQKVIKGVFIYPAIKYYIVTLVHATRPPSPVLGDLGPRTCSASSSAHDARSPGG